MVIESGDGDAVDDLPKEVLVVIDVVLMAFLLESLDLILPRDERGGSEKHRGEAFV